MTKRFVSTLVALFIVCGAAPAWAGQHEDSVARFDEGRALLKAGRPTDAIPKFLASLAAEPSAVAALNLADCYERVGKYASAKLRWEQAEALSKAKGDNLRAAEAKKRAEILQPRIATMTLLPPPASMSGSAWIDGTPLPGSDFGKPLPFDAGDHEVVLQAADGRRQTKIVSLKDDGAKITIPFDVGPPLAAPAEKPADKPAPKVVAPSIEEERPNETLRIGGYVAGGIGVASLIAGGVTGFLALDARSDLDATCSTYPRCPRAQQGDVEDIQSRGQTMATVSTITLVAGAALVATGVVMWIFSSPKSSGREQRAMRPLGVVTF